MKRTVALKLDLSQEQSDAFLETQVEFSKACNETILFVVENRYWNRVALHHLCYYKIRKNLPNFRSQMTCFHLVAQAKNKISPQDIDEVLRTCSKSF